MFTTWSALPSANTSVDAAGSVISSWSLSWIVTTPTARPIVPTETDVIVTITVSSSSAAVSPTIVTPKVVVREPAAIVAVPVVAVKSVTAVAVPAVTLYPTVIAAAAHARLRRRVTVAVDVPLSPSTMFWSSAETTTPSSSVMVTVVGPPAITPDVPTRLLSVTWKVSLSSAIESLVIGTTIVIDVVPGAKVSLPLVAVKSVPLTAVPPLVAKSTVIVDAEGPDRVTTITATPAASLTETAAGAETPAVSLSWMVAVAVPVAMLVPAAGLESSTVNVSSLSSSVSSTTTTPTVFTPVSPASHVTVPATIEKSAGDDAVTGTVEKCTVTSRSAVPLIATSTRFATPALSAALLAFAVKVTASSS
eukprot:comp22501_c0_seq1/m.56090 comp22501_c0_seq1/g.56090  ORF comp22501_c0_seq1/g.56090 comp22501_c0_seq1/m.56090 type:complete len:363 (-) comp22501_c0_seq1:1660-2748(-)